MWWGFGENGFWVIWLALIPQSLNNRRVQHNDLHKTPHRHLIPPPLTHARARTHTQLLIQSSHPESSVCTASYSVLRDHGGKHALWCLLKRRVHRTLQSSHVILSAGRVSAGLLGSSPNYTQCNLVWRGSHFRAAGQRGNSLSDLIIWL